MSKKGSGLGKLLAGIGIGVGIGMLVSPKSGAENRKALKEGCKKTCDKIKEIDIEEVKENLVKEYDKFMAEMKDMTFEKATGIARKKGSELLDKANELIKLAQEKSQPVIEKTAKEMKKNLSNVLKAAAEKLED